jgi:hypothetical protein
VFLGGKKAASDLYVEHVVGAKVMRDVPVEPAVNSKWRFAGVGDGTSTVTRLCQ